MIIADLVVETRLLGGLSADSDLVDVEVPCLRRHVLDIGWIGGLRAAELVSEFFSKLFGCLAVGGD